MRYFGYCNKNLPYFNYANCRSNTLDYIAYWMIKTAKRLDDSIRWNFNGVMITAHPKGSSVKSIIRFYWKELKKQDRRWRKLPEGKAEIEKEKKEQVKFLKLKKEAIAQGIVLFKVRNRKLWKKIIRANKKEMSGMLRFTSRWASLMEIELAKGRTLDKIIATTSDQADTEVISHFELVCAKNILFQIWKYGKVLEKYYSKQRRRGK